jgi:hypothetical protein
MGGRMIHYKSPIKNKRRVWFSVCGLRFAVVGFGLAVSLFTGCAGMKEVVRSVAGTSTREVEKSRKNSIKKVFKCDYFTCYAKTQDALKRIGAYVYAEDKEKDLIAIYVSEKDTTPVGLFFQDIDNTHTQIEISSPSSFARDSIAEKIFANLETFFYRAEKERKIREKDN